MSASTTLNIHSARNKTIQESIANKIKKYLLIATDILAILLSIVIGYAITHFVRIILLAKDAEITMSTSIETQATFFILPTAFFIISSWSKGHYTRFRPFWDEYRDIIKSVFILMGFLMAYLFIIKSHFSRLWFFSTWSLVLLTLPVSRIFIRKLMIKMKLWYVPTLFIGDAASLKNASTLESDYYLGNKIIGLFVTGRNNSNDLENKFDYPLIQLDSSPAEILAQHKNPQTLVQMSVENHTEQLSIIEKFAPYTNTLSIIPALGEMPLYGAETYHIFSEDIMVMRLKNNLSRRWPRVIKRVFDVIVSTLLLLILSPLLLLLFLLIKKDGGNAFYGHQRVGESRKLFNCYKFRSMAMNSDELLKQLLETNKEAKAEWDKDFKLKNDPRITPIGKFIRKTSIDELPQLWNVIKGDMSLVGPRPVIEEELERYGEKVSYYLGTKPGITGLWQVSGRNDTDYTRRVELDAWYVRNWALWYDLVILIKTIKVVFGKDGAY